MVVDGDLAGWVWSFVVCDLWEHKLVTFGDFFVFCVVVGDCYGHFFLVCVGIVFWCLGLFAFAIGLWLWRA